MATRRPPVAAGSAAPPAGSPPGGGASSFLRKNKTLLMVGGAGLVVVFALASSRGSGGGDASTVPYFYDSTGADLYNAIQPGLEDMRDRIGDLEGDQPRPQEPGKDTGGGGSTPKPSPKPKPGKSGPKYSLYTIRRGDTLSEIGQRKGVNWHKLWKLNANKLRTSAKHYGYKGARGGDLIFPGTRIRVPK